MELCGKISLKVGPAIVVLHIHTINNVVWVVSLLFFSIIFASRPPAFNESLKGTVPLSSFFFFLRKSELDNLNNSASDARHKSGVQSSQWVVLPDPLGFVLQNSQKRQLILCWVPKRNRDKITNKELLVPLHWVAWQQLLSSNPKVGAVHAQIFHSWWTRGRLFAPCCS